MNGQDEFRQLLQSTKCFADLCDQGIWVLGSRMDRISFCPGENLCAEGDVGDWMLVIEEGEVAVMKHDDAGEHIEVALLSQGDVAGEMSLFSQSVRTADLIAKTPVVVWTLTYDNLCAALDQYPSITRGLLATLSGHLSRGTSLLAKLMARDVDRRFKVAVFDSKSYMEAPLREANVHDYSLRFFADRLTSETVALAAGCQAVCVFVNDVVDESVVEELAALDVQLVALRCAGFNNVNLEACERLGVSVVRVPAYSPYAVAEHAVALMLTLNRKTHRANNRIREGDFSLSGLVGFDMHGRTAGVVGAGKIGVCALEILRGFGCRLLAVDCMPNPDLTERLGVEFVELDQLLAESDIISLHAPMTPDTHHMIDAKAIARMKDGVMLINTSRGGLIDTAALLNALKSGKIGYAGLDVYEEESGYFFEDYSDRVLADDMLARLTTFNNVVVTSHQGFLTEDALSNIAATTIASMREFEEGRTGAELTHGVLGD
ncbi:MAG: cyclic nucleotide-binding domain-containing protein [Lentisphaeria bacterium]|nr:cyclic nucleotide-binding domain-containing protein [Lentisphaeria bacterium]